MLIGARSRPAEDTPLDLCDDPVLDDSDPVDFASYRVAHEQRFRRFEAEAHSARGSREDQISRLQCHRVRQFFDLLPYIKDQMTRIRILSQLAVDERTNPKRVRVANFIRGYDARTEGTVAIK